MNPRPAVLWAVTTVQVRVDAAGQKKRHAIAAAREEAYAKYANIYKDHAAERYARAVEVSRQGKGGLEAFRRRVVAASTDAERYRGYVEMNTPRDDGREKKEQEEGGPGLRLLLGDRGNIPSDIFASSSDSREDFGTGSSSSSPSAPAVGKGSGRVADDGGSEVWLGDGAASEGSAALASGGVGFAEGGHAPTATRNGRGGDGSGRGSFVDVVPFNNVRAKYLRPLSDMELSRPYHVAPSPGWRADGAAGSWKPGSSMGGSSAPTSAINAAIDAAASERTMEAYRKTKQRDPVAHRRSKTLNRKERRQWGAH